FRNKDEILDGLVARYTVERGEYWAERLAAVTPEVPLKALVAAFVDESVAFKSRSPAYWALLYGSATGDRLAAASQRLHAAIAEQVAALLLRRSPGLDPDRALLMGTMAVSMVKAVVPHHSPALTEELKAALTGYLSNA
ncbi:TetR/AcrR family transcriptional regulator, partial [Nonomuraea sp. NPDC003804]